jgi:SPP1 gp7 family putative phage head morphogenesis protein
MADLEGLITRRLAAWAVQRQAERLSTADALAQRIRSRIEALAQRIARDAQRLGLPRIAASLDEWIRDALAQVAGDLASGLEMIAKREFDMARQHLAAQLPTELILAAVWRRFRWRIREDEASSGQVEVNIPPQGLSEDELRRLVRDHVMPPPDAQTVKDWLTKAPPGGLSWDQRLKSWNEVARRAFLAQAIQGLSQGENVAQLEKRLRPFVDGLAYKSQRIARTEACRVAQRAADAAIDGLGDIVAARQIVAVMDEHTRPEHAARHGRLYRRGADGVYRDDTGAPLPDLPDAPNCRCLSVPVFKMPQELQAKPELVRALRTEANKIIPDPAAYQDWWQRRATDKQRKHVVGVQRYDAVQRFLAHHMPHRQPDFADFLDANGQLLPLSQLQHQTLDQWRARRMEVDLLLAARRAAYQVAASQGIMPNPIGQRADIARALSPALAQAWRDRVQKVAKSLTELPTAETARRQRFASQLRRGKEVSREIDRRRQWHEHRLAELADLRYEVTVSTLPAPDQEDLLAAIRTAQARQQAIRHQTIHDSIEVPQSQRGTLPAIQPTDAPADARQTIEAAIDWMSRVITKHVFDQIAQPVPITYGGPQGRPYYRLDQPQVVLFGRYKLIQDTVHELTHHVEQFAKQLRAKMTAYYDQVTKGATPQHLGSDYGPQEMYLERTDGKPWPNPYQGFVGGREILTMAMEMLYDDPQGLLDYDRELFELLVDGLHWEPKPHVGGRGNPGP